MDRCSHANAPALRVGFLLVLSATAACGNEAPEVSTPGPGPRPVFTDITEAAGLRLSASPPERRDYYMPESAGSGGALFDYDGDGDLDVYVVRGARGPRRREGVNRLFRQDGGRFVDVTEGAGLGDPGYGMGVAVGDVDNDGDPDVFVTNVGPDALYLNDGDGSFRAAPAGALPSADTPWSSSATFLDYDLDGDLDVYVVRYVAGYEHVTCPDEAGRPDYCGPQSFHGVPDALYRNRGDGTFEDVSGPAGIDAPASNGLGVASADLSGDGWPDIYVANDGEANFLWVNRGDGTFRDEAGPRGAALNAMGLPEASMGVAIGDIEGDGDLDLFLTHLSGESNTMYRTEGPSLRDDTAPLGLRGPGLPYTGFGTAFLDVEADGDLDLIVANGRIARRPGLAESGGADFWAAYAEPNLVFLNEGDGVYRDARLAGPGFRDDVRTSRGLATGDIDDDGDTDVLIVNAMGSRLRLLRNDTPGGHWLRLLIRDPARRRVALGARFEVHVGPDVHAGVVSRGFSYLSSSDPRPVVGLGAVTRVDSVIVEWPGGAREHFEGGPADRERILLRGAGTRE
ncbi:MAG: CRTAC1 family protein [Gemmatimonadota bacterium]